VDPARTSVDVAIKIKLNVAAFTAFGIFLFFGAVMASFAATTLLWPGTPLDRLWTFNRTAYEQLGTLGKAAGILFLLLGATLTLAGIGWFRHRLWGLRLAIVILVMQVLGDLANCVRRDMLHGGVGVVVASAMLFFLLRPGTKAFFV